MTNKTLLLWLEAPLQSWGYESKFGRRGTLDFPTKSGVLGLICCAMGVSNPDASWLASMADLDIFIEAFSRKDRTGNRRVREPVLTDFHMIGSGYDVKDPWEALLIPKTADGKNSVGGGSKLTYRHYLQDMAFAVHLEIPETEVFEIKKALTNPIWDIYLGRKSCAPTEFVFQGVFDDIDESKLRSAELREDKDLAISFSVVQGDSIGEVITLSDVPVQLGANKAYRDRKVTVIMKD